MKAGKGARALTEKIHAAPSAPGVYVMRDATRRILYIGKAKSLRTRLRSYTNPSRLGPRAAFFLRQVRSVEYFVTDTEVEALILENSLIKKWKPKYNIDLKDDKTHPFLRLSVQEEFPTLTVVRRPASDGAKYFGPYIPAGAMHRTLRLLRRIFPLRRCSRRLTGRRLRPCLNHQMGRCLAPCAGKVAPDAYGRMVKGVALFLQGRGRELASELRREMKKLASEHRFEEAAVLRDRIESIDSTMEKQKAYLPGRNDMDIVGMVRLGTRRAYAVLHGSHGRIVGARTFTLPHLEIEGDEKEALGDFIRAFYRNAISIPPEVVLPLLPEGAPAIGQWLGEKRGKKVRLLVPKAGPLRSLVVMASKNALRAMEKSSAGRSFGEDLLGELGRLAGREGPLSSLAAIDVSTLSGSDPVASCVWWEDGRFVKKHYRRFRIRAAPSSDDYAMMAEAVGRLAGHVDAGDWAAPDILLLDGGRGQLSSGLMALRRHEWTPDLVAAIAKPRAGRRLDAVFAKGMTAPLDLQADSPLMKLLQEVRDEAHRFAVTYHRHLRRLRGRKSALDGVPGVGPVRRKLLLRRFGSLAKLREATLEELQSVPGLPRPVAASLFEYLSR